MRIVVISDTHLLSGAATRLPTPLLAAIESCDLVLHAGDVTTPEILRELSSLATVHCVLGNNDTLLAGLVPKELILELDGVRVAMIHDSGSRTGRAARLSKNFPDAHLVVYGHSHVPDDSEGLGGQRLFNPGSPTHHHTQPVRTYGILELRDGTLASTEICSLGS